MTAVIEYGERRHIKLLIKSCKNEDFQLINVQYEFRKRGQADPIESGMANVIDHLIDIVVEPTERGQYYLKVTYQISDEVLIDTVQIKVI